MGKVKIDELELHILKDKALLWDSHTAGPTYFSFYTGHNGQGGVLKERYFTKRRHHDAIAEHQAEKKGRKLGACSYVQFKQIGMPVSISYGVRGQEEERFHYLENYND